jgi:hypothetical protein
MREMASPGCILATGVGSHFVFWLPLRRDGATGLSVKTFAVS